MPHLHSAASIVNRRARAIRKNFLIPRPTEGRYIAVAAEVADHVKAVAASLEVQRRHNLASGTDKAFGRGATRAAKPDLDPQEFRSAMIIHDNANLAKHDWSACSARRWADVVSEEEEDKPVPKEYPASPEDQISFDVATKFSQLSDVLTVSFHEEIAKLSCMMQEQFTGTHRLVDKLREDRETEQQLFLDRFSALESRIASTEVAKQPIPAVSCTHLQRHQPSSDQHSKNLLLKTKMCKFWSSGCCLKGEQCNFAHGHEELVVSAKPASTQAMSEIISSSLDSLANEIKSAFSFEKRVHAKDSTSREEPGRADDAEETCDDSLANLHPINNRKRTVSTFSGYDTEDERPITPGPNGAYDLSGISIPAPQEDDHTFVSRRCTRCFQSRISSFDVIKEGPSGETYGESCNTCLSCNHRWKSERAPTV